MAGVSLDCAACLQLAHTGGAALFPLVRKSPHLLSSAPNFPLSASAHAQQHAACWSQPLLHNAVTCLLLLQLNVKKLAELAKSSCGRKRMRLDTAAAQQQLKHLLQQEQADSGAPSEAGQQEQSQGAVKVKQEQPQSPPPAAAAVADAIKLEAGEQQQQLDVKVPLGGTQEDIGGHVSWGVVAAGNAAGCGLAPCIHSQQRFSVTCEQHLACAQRQMPKSKT